MRQTPHWGRDATVSKKTSSPLCTKSLLNLCS